jgi:hypothetical protein
MYNGVDGNGAQGGWGVGVIKDAAGTAGAGGIY